MPSLGRMLQLICMVLALWVGAGAAAWASGTLYVQEQAVWLEDATSASPQEARGQSFTPYSGALSLGYRSGATWVRLRLAPSTDLDAHLVIALQPSHLDEVRLFDPDAPTDPRFNDLAPERITGDRHPIGPTDYASHRLGFVVPPAPYARNVYLRMVNRGTHFMHVEVAKDVEIALGDQRRAVFIASLWALSAAVLVWAMLAWWRQRDAVMASFVVKQAVAVVHLLFQVGLSRIILPSGFVAAYGDLIYSTSALLLGLMIVLFEMFLLREFRPPQKAWRVALGAMCFVSASAFVALLLGHVTLALMLNMVLINAAPCAFLLFALTAQAWSHFANPGEAPEQPILPRWIVVGYHAAFVAIMMYAGSAALGLPVFGSFALGLGFYAYTLLTGALVVVLLQMRLLRREAQAAQVISKLRSAEQQAIEEARRRDEQRRFLAVTSHELRTPINGIVGLAELARAPDADPRQRLEYLDQIAASGQALSDILNEVLDLSKIESGKMQVESVEFDLHQVARALHALHRTVAVGHKLKWVFTLADDVPRWVRGDALRVRQIIGNFLSNALKFTPTGGIELALKMTPAGLVRIEVHDSGIGIEAQALERLFQPYGQVDVSTARHFGGTGLGLFICRELATLMGGRVGVDSKVGQGSCFWAELALPAVARRVAAHMGSAFEGVEDLTGVRILLAEDNALNRHVAVSMLKRMHAQVDAVGDGHEAVQAWEAARDRGQPYDVILMDLQMPILDGLAATRRIRASRKGNEVPVIAQTAAAFTEERDAALQAGVDAFVTKPIDFKALVARIAACAHGIPGWQDTPARAKMPTASDAF